jgi:FkbM family methyltransferase
MFYKLDRFSDLHKIFRILGNRILWALPSRLTYSVGTSLRKRSAPYSLISEGDKVIQIGAPWDLLEAGRSRTIHFARLVGKTGHVWVYEPDPENVDRLEKFIEKNDYRNITVIPLGAWSHETRLRFLIDDLHPASNLVEDVFDVSRVDQSKYRIIEIDVESLKNLFDRESIPRVKLCSITSNGSEAQILEGVENVSDRIQYISIVGHPSKYSLIDSMGFKMIGEDDRGYIYEQAVS